jgi:hypothetical protein
MVKVVSGQQFTIEFPTGSGTHMTLFEAAREFSTRLQRIFLRDAKGRRAVHRDTRKFQEDSHWRDLILFYEYFHGDNGAGIAASHHTGWTGLVSALISLFGAGSAERFLQDRGAGFERLARIHDTAGSEALSGV